MTAWKTPINITWQTAAPSLTQAAATRYQIRTKATADPFKRFSNYQKTISSSHLTRKTCKIFSERRSREASPRSKPQISRRRSISSTKANKWKMHLTATTIIQICHFRSTCAIAVVVLISRASWRKIHMTSMGVVLIHCRCIITIRRAIEKKIIWARRDRRQLSWLDSNAMPWQFTKQMSASPTHLKIRRIPKVAIESVSIWRKCTKSPDKIWHSKTRRKSCIKFSKGTRVKIATKVWWNPIRAHCPLASHLHPVPSNHPNFNLNFNRLGTRTHGSRIPIHKHAPLSIVTITYL